MSRKPGPLKGGKGTPARAGDLTPQAAVGGWRPHAAEFGSHPGLADRAPAPSHRPPGAAGVGPAAIAGGLQQHSAGARNDISEAAA